MAWGSGLMDSLVGFAASDFDLLGEWKGALSDWIAFIPVLII